MARKILLADDSVTAQNMGRKILADAGYEVITVNNGSAALKKIAEAKPDLIVLDVYMPGYSGLEVCQRLKEVQETSRIPILLTVGKLEPFKPEEAKRVRAEGFIVKPFEASELLGALAKLEEKIVPRAESSKPGRFARAVAAVEEGAFDKSMAVEEDSGWKDRIAFPKGKKKKAAEEDNADDPAIYNPVNRDLRTVVEQHRAPAPQEVKTEGAHLDLGALLPEGLPKDVTAEEIAALAAAAAQVKSIMESKTADPAPAPRAAAWEDARIEESKTEESKTPELKIEDQPETSAVAQVASPEPVAPAEVAPLEKFDTPAEKSAEAAKEIAPEPSPSHAELAAAIAALEPDPPAAENSGNGFPHVSEEHRADEPVTMAVAASTETVPVATRWSAVAVALAPEEAAVSLEQEMQKAQADAAAAEAAHAELVAAFVKNLPIEPEPTTASTPPVPLEVAVPELAPQIETPAPQVERPVSSVDASPALEASAATEAIRAAVRNFETVEVSRIEEQPPVQPVNDFAAVPTAEFVAQPVAEPPQAQEIKSETNAVVEAAPEAVAEVAVQNVLEPVQEAPKQEEAKQEDPAPVAEIAAQVTTELPEVNSLAPDAAFQPVTTELPAEQVSTIPASVDHVSPEAAAAPVEAVAPAIEVMAKKESEIAETTAAAWASWRRIRESGDGKGHTEAPAPKEAPQEAPAPPDTAAMAVAAGAESVPKEAASGNEPESAEIASIVDSVLADMRPKIVAEISKKLGKKK